MPSTRHKNVTSRILHKELLVMKSIKLSSDIVDYFSNITSSDVYAGTGLKNPYYFTILNDNFFINKHLS